MGRVMGLGSKVPVPRRKVLHVSWSDGYRSGTRLHFILECGHNVNRPASQGEPKTTLCRDCWAIEVCQTEGHLHRDGRTPCHRCLKPLEKFGTAAEQIARYGTGGDR